MSTNYVTPVGEVKFPKIPKEGKRTVAVTFDPVEAADFLIEMEKAVAESKFPKSKIYKEDKSRDPDTNEFEPNGRIIMNFISHYPINFFDAKKNPIEVSDLGWGSKVRVSFQINEFDVEGKKGLCKYIKGIQVIDLQGGASADSCGFGEEEGFVGTNKDQPWEE